MKVGEALFAKILRQGDENSLYRFSVKKNTIIVDRVIQARKGKTKNDIIKIFKINQSNCITQSFGKHILK